MLYPLIPLYIEEAWHYTPSSLKRDDTVHKLGWFKPNSGWYREDLTRDWEILNPLKESVLQILEQARQNEYFLLKRTNNEIHRQLVAG